MPTRVHKSKTSLATKRKHKQLENDRVNTIRTAFENHLLYTMAKDQYSATKLDLYKSLAATVKDQLVKRWIQTQQTYYKQDAKRVYYLSLEFLMGRALGNNLINLKLIDEAQEGLHQAGQNLEELQELEWDAGLGLRVRHSLRVWNFLPTHTRWLSSRDSG